MTLLLLQSLLPSPPLLSFIILAQQTVHTTDQLQKPVQSVQQYNTRSTHEHDPNYKLLLTTLIKSQMVLSMRQIGHRQQRITTMANPKLCHQITQGEQVLVIPLQPINPELQPSPHVVDRVIVVLERVVLLDVESTAEGTLVVPIGVQVPLVGCIVLSNGNAELSGPEVLGTDIADQVAVPVVAVILPLALFGRDLVADGTKELDFRELDYLLLGRGFVFEFEV